MTALIIPAIDNCRSSSATSSEAHKSGTDKQESSCATSIQADTTDTDKADESNAAEHNSFHGIDPHPEKQTSQHEAVKPASTIEQIGGSTSEATEDAQGQVRSVDAVPSLTDWDASFVLIPAKKAYSKKKLWPSLAA